MQEAQLLSAVEGAVREPVFTIRTTRFEIFKLLPEEAFDVWEDIRMALGKSMASVSGEGTSVESMIVQVALGIPKETLAIVREALFKHVQFTNAAAQTPCVLASNVGMAFDGLDVIHIYEVLVRSLAVNFTESILELLSVMEGGAPGSVSPPIKT